MFNKITAILFLLIFIIEPLQSSENYIVLKVNNNIITKVDIDNEYKYLIALNNNLKKLDKNKLYELSKESILREKIKKEEIEKYLDMETLDKQNAEIIFRNFYNNLGYKNEEEFKKYLEKFNLNLKNVKEKIFIEISWNNLIYNKFIDEIQINENLVKEQIKIKKKSEEKYYQLFTF